MKNKGFFSRRRARLPAPFKVNCAESLLLQKRRLKAGYCCKARGDPLSTGRSSTHRGCWCGLWPGRTERGCRRAGGRAPQASPGPPLRRTQGSHSLGVAQRVCPGSLGEARPATSANRTYRALRSSKDQAQAAGRAASDTSGGAQPVRGAKPRCGAAATRATVWTREADKATKTAIASSEPRLETPGSGTEDRRASGDTGWSLSGERGRLTAHLPRSPRVACARGVPESRW